MLCSIKFSFLQFQFWDKQQSWEGSSYKTQTSDLKYECGIQYHKAVGLPWVNFQSSVQLLGVSSDWLLFIHT